MNIIRSFFVRLIAEAVDHAIDWRLDAIERSIEEIPTDDVDGRLDAIEDTLRDMDRTLDAIQSDMPDDVDLAETLVRIGVVGDATGDRS